MPRATPSAHQLAKEIGLSLLGLTGSGKSGYITDDDVIAAAEEAGIEIPQAPVVKMSGEQPAVASAPMPVRKVLPPIEALELAYEVVLPVSVLEHMRFVQDDAYGNIVGRDLLALRTPVGQPNIPANVHKREFYPIEPAYFSKQKPKPKPKPAPVKPEASDEDDARWPDLGDTGHPVAEGVFAVSGGGAA